MILMVARERCPTMPSLYRLIPVDVHAIQVTKDTLDRAVAWSGGVVVDGDIAINVYIPTINGVLRANEGDYIVKPLTGGMDVMSEEDFKKKYEAV